MPSILEQYHVSDFLEWHRDGKLTLNPDFQRGSVWTSNARSYLLDTLLNQLPIPKVYLRTTIDVLTRRSVREVVDGQQRLRAIIDFGNDQLVLGKRAGNFAGHKYSTLSSEQQQVFLAYPIAVDQLLNANDDDVLEVFARLNSYTVTLSAGEKRHAGYQGDFKWSVRQESRRWLTLWDDYKILSVRQRVRMEDDSFMSEMFGIILDGVCDGGQSNVDKLYKKYDPDFRQQNETINVVNKVLTIFTGELGKPLIGTPLMGSPHFLMMYAALTYAIHGIPVGEMGSNFPAQVESALSDVSIAQTNLLQLASVIASDVPVPGYEDFWKASKSSTQRIASRRIRFPMYYKALLPEPI